MDQQKQSVGKMLMHNNPTLLLFLLIPNLPAAYHMVGTILVIIFLNNSCSCSKLD